MPSVSFELVSILAAPTSPAATEAVAVEWERIQLIVTLRGRTEGRVMLVAADRGEAHLDSMPADDAPAGTRRVRFNVFAGPGRRPLRAGRWRLVVADGVEPPEAVRVDAAVDPAWSRDFPHTGGIYRVEARRVGERAALEIVISELPAATRKTPTLRRRWILFQRALRGRLFAWLVRLLRALPRGRRPLVVFTSDSRATLGGNLQLVQARMLERGLADRVAIRTVLRPSVRSARSMVDRARMTWLFARADVIVLDDYQPAVYKLEPHPRVRIIQLWHAWGAFKTVGFSRIGKSGGPSPYSISHRNYTHAIVSSTHEVRFYGEAFCIPDENVIPTGTPRMDQFLDPDEQAAGRTRALKAFPRAAGREVILFAPTFRGANAKTARYPADAVDLEALYDLCTERDAVAIVKMHPFVRATLDIPPERSDRILDASATPVDVNDLLLIADLLITDYSSLIFEYAALGRPMLFYAFDLEEYVASRDFYEPFEAFTPGRIVRTFPELIEAIRRGDFEQHKVEPFARRHLPAEPGSATDRIIDQLILAR